MSRKFQIGYPYANSSPSTVREAYVVLKPVPYDSGFATVHYKGIRHAFADMGKGPSILNGVGRGVKGELFETEDERKSIVRNGKIFGQGASMQLALALAVYADDEFEENAPLLLFSSAIQQPYGAPPFIDATITTYCSEKEAKKFLPQKYEVAETAGARALVLPRRDAQILEQVLHRDWYGVEIISSLAEEKLFDNPVIIGIASDSLPELAEAIGIKPSYYRREKSTITDRIQSKIVFVPYAPKDVFYAKTIVGIARNGGFMASLEREASDEEVENPGWQERTGKKMKNSFCMVVCASPKMRNSKCLDYQLEQAARWSVPIVILAFEEEEPVLFKDYPILRDCKLIDLVNTSPEKGGEILEQTLQLALTMDATKEKAEIYQMTCPHLKIRQKLAIGSAYTVGRSEEGDIVFPKEFRAISRNHVMIDLKGPPRLIAYGQNGTILNSEKVNPFESVKIPLDRTSTIRLTPQYGKKTEIFLQPTEKARALQIKIQIEEITKKTEKIPKLSAEETPEPSRSEEETENFEREITAIKQDALIKILHHKFGLENRELQQKIRTYAVEDLEQLIELAGSSDSTEEIIKAIGKMVRQSQRPLG